MPLIYVNCPIDTFTSEARDALAKEFSVKSRCLARRGASMAPINTWVTFRTNPLGYLYLGGKCIHTLPIVVEVMFGPDEYDGYSREELGSYFTEAIKRRSTVSNDFPPPVHLSFGHIGSQNLCNEPLDSLSQSQTAASGRFHE